jgi:Carboxypeptidase regulatory-like domain
MRRMRSTMVCVTALAVQFTVALSAAAQLTTGSVTGTIKDAQGGVIPGATITLRSETRGTAMAPATTDANGDFVFPTVTADTYTIEVEMASFKTLKRPGVAVSPGSRIAVGTLTIEVGGASETVVVTGEAPVIQAASGERSFAIPTEAVQNLPMANRSFIQLTALTPGVVLTGGPPPTTPQRLGSVNNQNNIMMDGVSTMDTGSNGAIIQMNTESIEEVKVLTQGYQAEYGRSSGLQISAVTKSGTNRFRGSVYDVQTDSDWNANSKLNILNGAPKTISKSKDWGYSVGGPVGKPVGNNKLFFFYAHEYRPRSGGNDLQRYRFPTAAERAGDFSQSVDNNGNLYNFIKNPASTAACQSGNTAGCFADGGVVGRIPQSALYQPGLNILKMFPMPNLTNIPAGQAYNFEITRPQEDTISYQPAFRIDYQPLQKLRVSFKYQGQITRRQVNQGTLPGWNDSMAPKPRIGTEAVTVNYNLSSTMFLEGTYGRAGNQLAQNGLPVNDVSNKLNVGLGDLPQLFNNASVLNPDYYAYEILNFQNPPYWDGTTILKPPNFQWGNRVPSGNSNTAVAGPPNINYPGFMNINTTQDVSVNLTKVMGRHTMKAGFYNTHSLKRENNVQGAADNFGTLNFGNDTVGVNPFDTSFGFANAATGAFSSFAQASRYVEGNFNYNNTEWYVQDNWKVNNKLTLDYGVRFVHAQPQYDTLLQGGNFLPDKWDQSQAPALYVPGCVNNANPCTGTNRQAKNPITGQLLGPNTTLAIGSLVPNSGNFTNGLFQSGQGIEKTTYTFPMLNVGPRFGMAYDISGQQKTVLRGAVGVYFDRPRPGDAQALVGNPPGGSSIVTLRYGQLQTLSSAGLSTQAPPGLTVFQYDAKLPTSLQFSGGAQMMLPWATALDVSYVGLHSWNDQQPWNINSIDLGTAFLASNQDPTLPANPVAGAASYAATSPDLSRAYKGYGSMASTSRFYEGWRTFHSVQISVNRRFQNGVQFGLNDSIQLYDVQRVAPRFDHLPDGSFVRRADEAEAQKLLGDNAPQTHIIKGNAVWDLPDLRSTNGGLRILSLIINDWQLSTIWTASTGGAYTISQAYQTGNANVNLTGSPDFAPRIRIVGDTGEGCTSDPYRQFNTAAFQGPLVGSVGLESGSDYLRGCFSSTIDLSIARNIRMGGSRSLQLRVDMFNAPNSAQVTGRQTTMNLSSPSDPVTITNLPFDANGNLLPTRTRPSQAGFGAVNNYQLPRTIQAYIRFSF